MVIAPIPAKKTALERRKKGKQMFGFGMPKEHKILLQQIENALTALGAGGDARDHAKLLFDRAGDQANATFGKNANSNNLGDLFLASDENFGRVRVSAGLSIQDIRAHWNRSPLLLCVEQQIREARLGKK
ncbi:hypothetical protein [Glaciimonas sp. PAMC28666]|uniref:hypothetical protein n=1 Tax=Glaciimonas sp. PAMC28666 TaxID=2807626 RepID=UPI00196461DF|nr:hypothetical protein [Glaciimonas sp. PAMC28666]QRX82289.1 hypothetical protein JQN73_19705 [Glaciimonas sp. PAMC28666]